MDALSLTAQCDWLVNVEIKSFPVHPPRLVESVLEAIMQTGTASRVLLSSFDHRDIARIPGIVPNERRDLLNIPRGILVANPLFRPDAYVSEIVGAQTFHASASCFGSESVAYGNRRSSDALSGDWIGGLKARGIPTFVYTVNDSQRGGLADQLAEVGVDGLFTDDPLGMRSHFG